MKKTISAMLAAVLLLSLTACGGNNNNSDNNSSSAINADGSRETYVKGWYQPQCGIFFLCWLG